MELRDQMQKVALESPAYGYRRITRKWQQRDFAVNHKRVLRMMREDHLLGVRRRRFVVTTDSRHNLPIYPNLAWTMQPTALTSSGWPTSPTRKRFPQAALLVSIGGLFSNTRSDITPSPASNRRAPHSPAR